jgi:hypothetical protein
MRVLLRVTCQDPVPVSARVDLQQGFRKRRFRFGSGPNDTQRIPVVPGFVGLLTLCGANRLSWSTIFTQHGGEYSLSGGVVSTELGVELPVPSVD